eukprot:TRINITY_DN5433_c0_g1_i2.p1 TRINITY_DN5433_c0_g1~~TRINITY_DN5433_c0_g1_i2.p1  ORF type:complete len:1189 (-),score=357.81 TRINITY_DN5433_c0_g1_i2:45-3611(-)
MKVRIPNRLVDYFLLISCGDALIPLDPARARRVAQPLRILYKPFVEDNFPFKQWEDFELPEALPMFCMPNGLVLRDRHELPSFHSFVLTGSDGARVFGACLTFYETLDDETYHKLKKETENKVLLEARHRMQKQHKRIRKAQHRPRSMSRFARDRRAADFDGSDEPTIHERREDSQEEKHEEEQEQEEEKEKEEEEEEEGNEQEWGSMIPSDVAVDVYFPERMCVPKCIVILSHYPLLDVFRTFLVELYRISISMGKIPLERLVGSFVLETPLPPPGKVLVQFSIGKSVISIKRPPINEIPCPDVPFERLFQALEPRNVILVFQCILLEKKVLLISSHISLIGIVCEILLSLIFPFRWPNVYIPVLPVIFSDFLRAPVPYLIGTHRSVYREGMLTHDEVVVVDLDNNKVEVPFDLPAFPPRADAKLMKHLLENTPTFTPQSPELMTSVDLAIDFAPPPEVVDDFEDRKVRKKFDPQTIQKGFFRFFLYLFPKYRQFLRAPKDGESLLSIVDDPFRTDDFVNHHKPAVRPFLRELCGTQMFQQFIQDRIMPGGSVSEIMLFDESIQEKMNRSMLRLKKTPTPFLKDKDQVHTKTYVVPAPDLLDLDKDAVFEYPTFPKMDPNLMRPPRPHKVFVNEETDDFGTTVQTLSSWKTVLAFLGRRDAYLDTSTPSSSRGLKAHRTRLTRSSHTETNYDDVLGSPASDIDIEDVSALKDMGPHLKILDTLHFDLTDLCPMPECKHRLSNLEVRRGWATTKHDYRTTCPQCGYKFVARFHVFARSSHRHAMSFSQCNPLRKDVITCEYLSPLVTRKEVRNLLESDVACDTKLFMDHATIFWNLVVHFRPLEIPLSFLLPQVDWDMIGDHFRQLAQSVAEEEEERKEKGNETGREEEEVKMSGELREKFLPDEQLDELELPEQMDIPRIHVEEVMDDVVDVGQISPEMMISHDSPPIDSESSALSRDGYYIVVSPLHPSRNLRDCISVPPSSSFSSSSTPPLPSTSTLERGAKNRHRRGLSLPPTPAAGTRKEFERTFHLQEEPTKENDSPPSTMFVSLSSDRLSHSGSEDEEDADRPGVGKIMAPKAINPRKRDFGDLMCDQVDDEDGEECDEGDEKRRDGRIPFVSDDDFNDMNADEEETISSIDVKEEEVAEEVMEEINEDEIGKETGVEDDVEDMKDFDLSEEKDGTKVSMS